MKQSIIVSGAQESTPNETIAKARAQINEQPSDDLLDEVMKKTDEAFEQLALDLMTAIGYGSVDVATQVTPFVGDEGIDGIIMEDKLGLDLIYAQARYYAPRPHRGQA